MDEEEVVDQGPKLFVVGVLASRQPGWLCFATEVAASAFCSFTELYRKALGQNYLNQSGHGVYWLTGLEIREMPCKEATRLEHIFQLDDNLLEKMCELINQEGSTTCVVYHEGNNPQGINFSFVLCPKVADVASC